MGSCGNCAVYRWLISSALVCFPWVAVDAGLIPGNLQSDLCFFSILLWGAWKWRQIGSFQHWKWSIFAQPEAQASSSGSSCPAEHLHVGTQIRAAPAQEGMCALLRALELSHWSQWSYFCYWRSGVTQVPYWMVAHDGGDRFSSWNSRRSYATAVAGYENSLFLTCPFRKRLGGACIPLPNCYFTQVVWWKKAQHKGFLSFVIQISWNTFPAPVWEQEGRHLSGHAGCEVKNRPAQRCFLIKRMQR